MPQLGETVTEGTIRLWHKAVGDDVAAGEPLFDIETDKTTMEVPAVATGTLREIRAEAGETVAVGTIVAVIAEPDVAEFPVTVAQATSSATAPDDAPEPARAAPPDPFHGLRTPAQSFGKARRADGVKVSPRARRLAAEAHLDVATLQASGPQRRIVAADVLRAAAAGVASTTAPVAETDFVRALYRNTPHREVALDGMRKQIARRLSESKQNVPHFYVHADVRADALL
ncbi:MAG TPA: biotin/lipoyl-containing protein, partial [Steroidobacteraceae bacterium]|nr:biotin/lipoyl-containing protein [Steroidobacteraceae bacterium]